MTDKLTLLYSIIQHLFVGNYREINGTSKGYAVLEIYQHCVFISYLCVTRRYILLQEQNVFGSISNFWFDLEDSEQKFHDEPFQKALILLSFKDCFVIRECLKMIQCIWDCYLFNIFGVTFSVM